MHASGIFRWVIALLFGLFGWWLIIMNFAGVYAWFVRHKHSSWIPLVGGFFALVGMGLCPLPHIQRLAWIPLVVDFGYFISALVIGLLMELYARRTKRDR
jgi:hypothetical protein